MTLATRITELAAAIGADVKARIAGLAGVVSGLQAISPHNAHNVGGVLPGLVYDSAVFVTNQGLASTGVVNNLLLMEPFTSSADLVVSQIGVLVAIGFPTGTRARLGVYKTGANGWPGALLYDSGPIDISPASFRSVVVEGLTLLQGEPYWLAITTGTITGSGQFWGCPIPIAAPLVMLNATDAVSQNVLAFPFAFASATTPLPDPAPAVSSTTFRSMIFPSVKLVTPS